jgi:hypothetical protein
MCLCLSPEEETDPNSELLCFILVEDTGQRTKPQNLVIFLYTPSSNPLKYT